MGLGGGVLRFRTKLIIVYGFLALFSALFLGLGYYQYSMNHYKKTEYANLELLSRQLSQQLEETVKPMQAISNYILSDMNVLDALRTLTVENNGGNVLRGMQDRAKTLIQLRLVSYYILDNFYRVIVFNKFGIVIGSRDYLQYVINKNKAIDEIPWIGSVQNTKGKAVIIGCHADDWALDNPPVVFSVVKELQGSNLGYIEVQKEASILDTLFAVAKDEIAVLVVMDSGELLYSHSQREINNEYIQIAISKATGVSEYPVAGDTEVIASFHSNITNTSVLVIENMRTLSIQGAYVLPATFLVAFLYFLVFFICIIALTNQLTKPITSLTKMMEKTRLSNLKSITPLETGADEIKLLSAAYQQLMLHLDAAIVQERRLSTMQLQAQMDLLQAQINPHFLYNVLNVITNRGMLTDDETICNMCDCLAQMLRYSTDITSKYATLSEETEYLKRYFYLMKCRYERKLEYKIDIQKEAEQVRMPKIVLQQLVENAILHGYEESATDVMRITINGEMQNGFCTLWVCDNGNGFRSGVMETIQTRMAEVKQDLMQNLEPQKMSFGGMGIINTYARLVVLFGNQLIFDIETGKEGTSIRLGFPEIKEE